MSANELMRPLCVLESQLVSIVCPISGECIQYMHTMTMF